MRDSRMALSGEALNPNSRKKNPSTPSCSVMNLQGTDVREVPQGQRSIQKVYKNMKSEGSTMFQQHERSSSDSLPDSSSSSGNEYRALRHKYLVMEEENLGLDRELKEVDQEVKALENEKSALLDQLVVLEGLLDPSELPQHGLH